ncbi:MAG: nucleotidyl transferase AbiEii/AbiGii toxin family protein [Clostridiales Family XIII bacterium]|nr:nucleotidyl transferase AbiEii/AbiGii toxin family protein [Clostridiales Family XIII bacterium]
MSLSEYYEEILYPLQNGVLNVVRDLDVPFYLTGGTALSRGYFAHRYSDDLDFFTNNDENFHENVNLVLAKLKENGFEWDADSGLIRSETFASLGLSHSETDALLKIDFVNDVVPHYGDFVCSDIFPRLDNVRNILSNKLGAVFRFSGKDIADIREIARHELFNWAEVISEARNKDGSVEANVIAEIVQAVPMTAFEEIRWSEPAPTWDSFIDDIVQIVRDLVSCGENSLYKEK